jgi:hypothetical protein
LPAVFNGSVAVPTGGSLTTASGVAPSFGAVPSWTGALPIAQGGTGSTTSIPLNQFSGLTAGNCVTATTSTTLAANGTCANTSSANTWTANQTVNAFLTLQENGVGSGIDHSIKFNNVAATKPDVADSIGAFYAYAPNINSGCSSSQPVSEMWPGISGATAGNYGGYWVFFTKYDGTCGGAEALVLDPQQHIFMPNDTAQFRQNTPGACTAGVTCMTITWTFTKPFLTTSGAAETPRCFAPGIYDESDSTQVWVANLKGAPTSTSVTYNIASLANVAAAHTLDMNAECHPQAY